MKKLIALLILLPCVMAQAQNLQITKITMDPAPQCPTATNPNPTTTVRVTVVGGKAPYTFSNPEFPNVTPTVLGNTGTFVFPVAETYTPIVVTDSSSPQLTAFFEISLFAQLFSSATVNFLSPCAGKNNGSITMSVTGIPAAAFELYDINNDVDDFVTVTSNSYTFTDLAVSSYEATVYSDNSAPCTDVSYVDIYGVDLNEYEPGFITTVADYVQRAYCQNCFNR